MLQFRTRNLNKISTYGIRAAKKFSSPSGVKPKFPPLKENSSGSDRTGRLILFVLNNIFLITTASIYATRMVKDEEFNKYNKENFPLSYLAPGIEALGDALPEQLKDTIAKFLKFKTKKQSLDDEEVQGNNNTMHSKLLFIS